MNIMGLPLFNTVDEIQLSLLKSILNDGDVVSARRMKTLEIHPTGFVLVNPRARCVTNTARRWSLPLAIGEFAWHLSASTDVNFISYYAKQWKNFSEDGKVIKESCYGHKIFEENNQGVSQWGNIVNLLSEDPATRRAVLSLYDSATDFGPFSKDVSCICTIQFLIRDSKLDAITHMRSNDVMLGLPYDLFLVTMLQEYLSETLSVQLGSYYHLSNSMHLYERHFKVAKDILRADYIAYEMPSMTHLEQIPSFLKTEEDIRKEEGTSVDTTGLAEYWKDLLSVLRAYHAKKINSHHEKTLDVAPHYRSFIDMPKPALT